MIEVCVFPAGSLVTGLTSAQLNFNRELTPMYIIVARFTGLVGEIEQPPSSWSSFTHFRVAGDTGYSQMRSGQGIVSMFMLGNIKFCRDKSKNIVAAFATACVSSVGKLSKMGILMAISAICKSHGHSLLTSIMTFFAC